MIIACRLGVSSEFWTYIDIINLVCSVWKTTCRVLKDTLLFFRPCATKIRWLIHNDSLTLWDPVPIANAPLCGPDLAENKEGVIRYYFVRGLQEWAKN